MDVQTNVSADTGAPPAAPTNDSGPLSVREAAERFTARREREAAPQEETKPEKARAPDGKFARTEDTAPDAVEAVDAEAPGDEVTEADDQASQEPTIDPPKSWSKEDKEAFRLLPPETQHRLVEQDQKRETDFLKARDEAAEIRRQAEARVTAAEQARQRYEQALPNLLQALQANQAGEFADIKSMDDVRKMADEDPFRYAKWDAQQKQIERVAHEVRETQRRQQEEHQQRFTAWAEEQDKLFVEQAKEFGDPEKSKKARDEVMSYLTEVRKVPKDQLPELWNNPLFRDAKMQLIIRDAAKWHNAQQAAKAAVTKPIPPVQRPGTARTKADADAANIKALEQKLGGGGTLRDQLQAAAALRAARRASAR